MTCAHLPRTSQRLLLLVTFLAFQHIAATATDAQTLNWAKRAGGPYVGGPRGDYFEAIAADAAGNTYVTGEFMLTGTFGPGETNETVLTSAGERDVVIAKYASNGRLAWVQQAGSTGLDNGRGIALDQMGNAYVTGMTSAPGAVFGAGQGNATTLAESGSFLAKYAVDGTLVWAKSVGGGGGRGVAVDEQGDIYLAGISSCFLAKYDPAGMLIWSRQLTSTTAVACGDIAVDAGHNTYVVGSFRRDATFDDMVLRGPVDRQNLFLARFSAEGEVSFAVLVGGTGYPPPGDADSASGVAVDSSGNAYITGDYGAYLFVAKYAPGGTVIWARHAAGTGISNGADVAVDAQDRIYVTGAYGLDDDDAATFGPGQPTATVAAGRGGFLAEYTSDGLFVRLAKIAGDILLALPSVAVDTHGGLYLSGSFEQTATFNSGEPGEVRLTSAGGIDMFIASYTAAAPLPIDIANDRVGLVVNSTSFNPAPVAGGPAGVFTISATLTNPSSTWILTPVSAVVNTLTGGNILLSATQGGGTSGSRQQIDVGDDNALAPSESRTVQFRIGLAARTPFTFLVDVEGVSRFDAASD